MWYHSLSKPWNISKLASSNDYRHRTTLLRIANEGLTPGNFDLLDEFIAVGYVVHSPFGDLNLEAVKGFFEALRNALSEFKVIRAHILVNEHFAATRSVVTGSFNQVFTSPNGVIPPNGKPVELQIISIFRFDEDGAIIEEWAQFDNLGFLTQLGVMTAQ